MLALGGLSIILGVYADLGALVLAILLVVNGSEDARLLERTRLKQSSQK